MNMQAQLLIERHFMEHHSGLLDELSQNGLTINGIPSPDFIGRFAQQDASGLYNVLQADELQALLQIVQTNRGTITACTIMYWVTFYLSFAHGEHCGWALRCFANQEVFAIYCNMLEKAILQIFPHNV